MDVDVYSVYYFDDSMSVSRAVIVACHFQEK